MNFRKSQLQGVTMIEMLVSVAIIGLLIVATTIGIRQHLLRADDAQRKSDLKKISTALEQYYNDHNGYPERLSTVVGGATCGANTVLKPYMSEVPCDPNGGTARPYIYVPSGTNQLDQYGSNVYRGYRLLAALQYKADPQIKELGCPATTGCGGIPGDLTVDRNSYNFGVTANAPLIVP